MNFKLIAAILAIIFLFVGYIPYFKDIFRKKTKPHLYTWLIWAITQGTAAAALIYGGGHFGGLSLIMGTILVLFIFFLSFKYGAKNITISDKIFLVIALLAIVVWWQLDDPLTTVLLVSLIDGLGYIPTIRKSFDNPWSETIVFWAIMAAVDGLALVSNAVYNPLTVIYLLVLMGANLMVVFVCLYRRRVLIKSSYSIKAIIFDYDGVIVDSFQSLFKTYNKICEFFSVSCPTDIEEFRKIYGYNYRECLNNLGIQERDFAKASEIYKKEMFTMDHGLFPGIAEVIQQLSRKYKLYLVSASFRQEVENKLQKYSLNHLFEEIYCSADDGGGKKSIIEKILKEHNYSFNEVMSIGDRVIDYDIAKKVGLNDNNIILTSYGWGLDKNKVGASHIVDEPNDILRLVHFV